jgi:PRTRC genetic system protein A
MKAVGYLLNTSQGISGEAGLYYDYLTGTNGVFITAKNMFLSGMVQVVGGEIRGLLPVAPGLLLAHGPVPQRIFDLALDVMLIDPAKERYVGIVWADGYHLYIPEQEASAASVTYPVGTNVIIDLHSHAGMKAFFSGMDDKDEQGLKVYGVIGTLNRMPSLKLRLGVYGYFHPLSYLDVFEGDPEVFDTGDDDVPFETD